MRLKHKNNEIKKETATIAAELTEEISVLRRYELSSTQLGIQVLSKCGMAVIVVTHRLLDKGLINKPDGGYLAALGRETAERWQRRLFNSLLA